MDGSLLTKASLVVDSDVFTMQWLAWLGLKIGVTCFGRISVFETLLNLCLPVELVS